MDLESIDTNTLMWANLWSFSWLDFRVDECVWVCVPVCTCTCISSEGCRPRIYQVFYFKWIVSLAVMDPGPTYLCQRDWTSLWVKMRMSFSMLLLWTSKRVFLKPFLEMLNRGQKESKAAEKPSLKWKMTAIWEEWKKGPKREAWVMRHHPPPS